jgi:hypothetical protein
MRPTLLLLTLLPFLPPRIQSPGESVIRQMHSRYQHVWPRTFTFEQKTTLGDGTVETWHEAGELPGKLRIDIAPLASGRAMLFRSDSLYNYRNGRRGRGGPLLHPLLLLLYDVHFLAPDTTIARLRALRFDLSRTHDNTWDGKAVTVIGALPGDSTSAQVWIEKERLLPVRLMQPSSAGVTDDRIGGYERVGQAWGERRVETWQGGRRIQLEEYSNVRTGVTHEPGLFEPSMEYKVPAWLAHLVPR